MKSIPESRSSSRRASRPPEGSEKWGRGIEKIEEPLFLFGSKIGPVEDGKRRGSEVLLPQRT